MRNKKAFFVASGLLLALIFMAACGPKPADTSGETPEVTEPTTEPQPTPISPADEPLLLDREIVFDPALLLDEDGLAVCELLYNGLVSMDASGNPVAGLAVNWTVSEDQLDYIFELRPNVVFSSGTPFNADAVMANFTRWFDPASPIRGGGEYAGWLEYFLGFKGDVDENEVPVSQFDGIEKVNELSILIHLNRPEPNLLSYLAQPYFSMVDPGVLAAEGDAYGTQEGSVSGTGAYVLTAWDDEGLTFVPSASYWGTMATDEIKTGWK